MDEDANFFFDAYVHTFNTLLSDGARRSTRMLYAPPYTAQGLTHRYYLIDFFACRPVLHTKCDAIRFVRQPNAIFLLVQTVAIELNPCISRVSIPLLVGSQM